MIFICGIAAGFLNTVAGGGSLLTMPILIFMGLPSAVANGTNRIALTMQNIAAVVNFRKKGYFDYKFSLILGIPAILGSIIGSKIAVSMPDEYFNRMLSIVMIIVLILILFQPQKRIKKKQYEKQGEDSIGIKQIIAGMIIFFFVGFYGGVIQAGVGFIIILSLTLISDFTLVRINSIKMFVVGIYILASLIVFIIEKKINLGYGLMLGLGNSIGAYLGSNFSVNKGDKWIKIILSITVIAMSAKLLGIFGF